MLRPSRRLSIAAASTSALIALGSDARADGATGPDAGNVLQEWAGFDGVRPHVGGFVAGGPFIATDGGASVGSFLFALKGGLLIERGEIGVEVSPFTWIPALDFIEEPGFQANLYGGYYIPITAGISYPLHGGLGIAAILNGAHTPLGELRMDVLGLAAIVGPVLLELNMPSLRIMSDFQAGPFLLFCFGVQGSVLPDAL
jgi:hypothetical protein